VIVPQRIGKAKPSRDRQGADLTPPGIARQQGRAERQIHLIRKRGWVIYPDIGVPERGLATEFQFIHGRASLGGVVRNMFLR
jgi:hypothetical protein